MSKPGNHPKVGGKGEYVDDYAKFVDAYNRHKGDCPRGVRLKLQKGKNGSYQLYLQFKHPGTGVRSPKPCGVRCTPAGVIKAVEKAHKVREALDTISKASDFWQWYETEVLEKNEIIDDIRTYRDIFKEIEDEYFSGYNRNTKRPRSREFVSDLSSFDSYYGVVFRLFPNWDIPPSWDSLKTALYTPLVKGGQLIGSKTFKDRYAVIQLIAEKSPNKQVLLDKLAPIDATQTIKKKKQRISLDEFKGWMNEAWRYAETIKNQKHYEARKSWLWVAGMTVMYGLRPTEIAAAVNLFKPFRTEDGVIIPAISDPDNKDNYLVLGDFTYFGPSIKTGGRIIAPVPSPEMFNFLNLKTPRLPEYKPNPNSKPATIVTGFDKAFSKRMEKANCPITEKYAFRRLFNLLGEKYGLPIELRARLMGHSTIVNENKYKTEGIDATLEVIKGSARNPLTYDAAIEALQGLGIDTNDESVKLILRVIYRLND